MKRVTRSQEKRQTRSDENNFNQKKKRKNDINEEYNRKNKRAKTSKKTTRTTPQSASSTQIETEQGRMNIYNYNDAGSAAINSTITYGTNTPVEDAAEDTGGVIPKTPTIEDDIESEEKMNKISSVHSLAQLNCILIKIKEDIEENKPRLPDIISAHLSKINQASKIFKNEEVEEREELINQLRLRSQPSFIWRYIPSINTVLSFLFDNIILDPIEYFTTSLFHTSLFILNYRSQISEILFNTTSKTMEKLSQGIKYFGAKLKTSTIDKIKKYRSQSVDNIDDENLKEEINEEIQDQVTEVEENLDKGFISSVFSKFKGIFGKRANVEEIPKTTQPKGRISGLFSKLKEIIVENNIIKYSLIGLSATATALLIGHWAYSYYISEEISNNIENFDILIKNQTQPLTQPLNIYEWYVETYKVVPTNTTNELIQSTQTDNMQRIDSSSLLMKSIQNAEPPKVEPIPITDDVVEKVKETLDEVLPVLREKSYLENIPIEDDLRNVDTERILPETESYSRSDIKYIISLPLLTIGGMKLKPHILNLVYKVVFAYPILYYYNL